MREIHLQVALSSDRNQSGLLRLIRDGRVIREYEALGRGSQGTSDTQMQVNGNTPTGQYRATQVVSTSDWNKASYGPNGAIRLEPLAGNAITAQMQIGRRGLLIHGGSPGSADYWRQQQQKSDLRATHGCIRLSDQDMRDLVSRLFVETLDPDHSMCVDLDVKVSVTDYNVSFDRPYWGMSSGG